MRISEVKFYGLKFDSDFKETKDGNYQTIAKAKVGKDELESVIIIELLEKDYRYVSSLDYKNLEFETKGTMQIRKNKKDTPFMYFKVHFIMSMEDLEKVQIAKRVRLEKQQNFTRNQTKKEALLEKKKNAISWYGGAEQLGYKMELMDSRKIKFIDEEHLKKAQVEFKYPKEPSIVAVRPIPGTEEYELLLGWKGLIVAKLLELHVRAYVIDLEKKEFLEKLNNL